MSNEEHLMTSSLQSIDCKKLFIKDKSLEKAMNMNLGSDCISSLNQTIRSRAHQSSCLSTFAFICD
jgi:hypothetical protein